MIVGLGFMSVTVVGDVSGWKDFTGLLFFIYYNSI